MTEYIRKLNVDSSMDDRFLLKEKSFASQFSNIYKSRLDFLKPHLIESAIVKWGNEMNICHNIIDYDGNKSSNIISNQITENVLIGTIYKELKARNSVLDDFKESKKSGPQISTANAYTLENNICSEDDALILEDLSARVLLKGDLVDKLKHIFVTGICVALKGYILESGEMMVLDYTTVNRVSTDSAIENGLNVMASKSLSKLLGGGGGEKDEEDSCYMLFVSGLQFGYEEEEISASVVEGQESGDAMDVVEGGGEGTGVSHVTIPLDISYQLLVDYINGNFGNSDLIKEACQIQRVVIVGNSIAPRNSIDLKQRYSNASKLVELTQSLKKLDIFLSQVLVSVPVDIMPGELDPTIGSLPQQPLNPCLLPHASRFNTFHTLTNPVQLHRSGDASTSHAITLLGHSGQAIENILWQTKRPITQSVAQENSALENMTTPKDDERKVAGAGGSGAVSAIDIQNTTSCNQMLSELEVLQNTLEWGHLCPVAPDTLPCHPYGENDPFVIVPTSVPDVFFSGNCRQFAMKEVIVQNTGEKCTLLCIPRFHSTRQAVLFDIVSHNYRIIQFG